MVTSLNHLTFSVADLDRAFRFYSELLGLRPVARWYKGAYLTAGDTWVCLTLEADLSDRLLNPTYDHTAFSVPASDFEKLSESLMDAGVQRWQDNKSEGESLYFLDPDGHKLEIHASDLQIRVESLKRNPPKGLILFDPSLDL